MTRRLPADLGRTELSVLKLASIPVTTEPLLLTLAFPLLKLARSLLRKLIFGTKINSVIDIVKANIIAAATKSELEIIET